MRARQRRAGFVAYLLVVFFVIGCSEEEQAPMDAGVSPFYPGPAGSEKAAARSDATGTPSAGEVATSRAVIDRSGLDGGGSLASETPLRTEDVERQLRIAQLTAKRGETAKAISSLDRILAFEPLNREALLSRAFLALMQADKAPAAVDRAAAIEKAAALMRTLRRAYEKPTKPEISVFAQVSYIEARMHAEQGRFDRAVAVLRDAYDTGFDPFERIASDEAMASLRSSPEYGTLLKTIDEANLAAARARVKNFFDKPLDFSFDFKVDGLDGKPLSLDQLKGKVVVIDIWGTWCKPCREAIPSLVQLYRRHHRLGLEVVGLAFEPNAPSPQEAKELVKQFVKAMDIPYPCAVGDETILEKIPNFHAFPTTMVLDRAGKVRFLVLENSEGVIGAVDSLVQVLLAEPATPAAPTPAKVATPAPHAATKNAEAKPVGPATPTVAPKKADVKPK